VRFLVDHAQTIDANSEHVYAIAEGSATTPEEFEARMAEIGAPLKRIERPGFMTPLVQAAYKVDEVTFDIRSMKKLLSSQLWVAGVPQYRGTGFIQGGDEDGVDVSVSESEKYVCTQHLRARYVFNCTYGALDEVGARIKTGLQKELTEVVLLNPPSILMQTDITIMDGPFWSLMNYPGGSSHALTHVTHTVHERWFPPDRPVRFNARQFSRDNSAFSDMIADAVRYVPAMAGCSYKSSLWTTRVVLAENENDDGRPTLVEYDERTPRIISVLGSKFGSVYDVTDWIAGKTWET
jgi:hypothetical protein